MCPWRFAISSWRAKAYQRLGFVLKPGTPHANGITNFHAKFRDGTEIELITAPQAVDELTRTYRAHLKQGDGPAFLALHAPDAAAMNAAVPRNHPARSYIFFGGLNRSPTDRPEHFEHPNTAESLISVWLAADDFASERDLLRRAGVSVVDDVARVQDRQNVPGELRAPTARFGSSTLVLLPASYQRVSGRRIVGATIRVANLEAAAKALRAGGVPVPPVSTATDTRSLFVSPDVACGWWLELRENLRTRAPEVCRLCSSRPAHPGAILKRQRPGG